MKAAALLCLVVVFACVDAATEAPDVLSPFVRERLNDALREASGSWDDNTTFSSIPVNLVKGSYGWLSFREANLYNLSTWALAGDCSQKCDSNQVSLTANIGFQPLMINLSYLYDNGTALYPSDSLWATLSKLTAKLVLNVDLSNNSASVSSFELHTKSMSLDVSGDSPKNVKKEDMTTALGRMLSSGSLAPLPNLIENAIGKTLLTVTDWTVLTQACATTTASTTPTTPTTNPTTTTPTTTTPTTKTPTTTTPTTTTPTTTTPTTTTPTTTTPTTTTPTTTTPTTTTPTTTTPTTTTPASNTTASNTKKNPNKSNAGSHGHSSVKPSANSNSGSRIKAITAAKTNAQSGDHPNHKEQSRNLIRDETRTDQTSALNKMISDLLSKTGEVFPDQKLQPYKLTDSEQELYQSEDGAATLEVALSGLRSLTISGDPKVEWMKNMVMVTADVAFANLMYSADVLVNSSKYTAEGQVSQLIGQLMVDADWKNTSAEANVVFQGFKLMPFVSLSGNTTAANRTERANPDDSELMSAVRGAFKRTVVSKLYDAIWEPVKNVTTGKIWNIEAALTSTQAPAPTTPHSYASPLSPLRAWTIALVSALPALLASKMLL